MSSRKRARLRESIRRLGEALASNLDRPALLELALQTAVDAVQSGRGRVSARAGPDGELGELAEHAMADSAILSVPLGPSGVCPTES